MLVDTGAPKMWMARLYPTYEPNTCLISNGLVDDGVGAARRDRREDRRPDAKVLAWQATARS